MTTVLKFGGSLITEKQTPRTVDRSSLREAVATLAGYAETTQVVLVHGGGSFGHQTASTYGVSATTGTRDAVAVDEIHRSMGELNDAVLAACHEYGLPAVPVRPLSVAHRNTAGDLQLPAEPVGTLLGEEFLPVLHGDVIAHAGSGATVLSGDDIVVSFARSLDAETVGLCSTVPGVLDEDGAVIDEIRELDTVTGVLGGSDATDVTGGMGRKVRRLLELDTPASVFDLDALDTFLETGTAGTVIRGGDGPSPKSI
ncbi:MAG: isopentenyl phosphate kinase [Halovenus sp.]